MQVRKDSESHFPESHPMWPLGFLVESVSEQRNGDELKGKAKRLSRKKLIGYTKRQGPQGEEIGWRYGCRRMKSKSGEVGMKGHGYPVPEQVLCTTFTLTI